MSTLTTRLSATKPASSENVDISVLNTNFDLVDSAVGATVASAASRPASTWQGRIWYAQDTDKLYVNEAANASTVAVWVEPVAQARTFIRKAANQSYASQTTLQNDNDILFSLAASAVYTLRAFLAVSGSAASDVKTAWIFTGAASGGNHSTRWCKGPNALTTDAAATSMRDTEHAFTTAVGYGLDGSNVALIEEGGVLDTAAGSGTIRLQWAQLASNAASTILTTSSYAVLERMS